MIISSAPVRLSLASSDHREFAERYGGNALNFTINRRVYVFIRPRNSLEDTRFRVSYSRTELCNSVEEIKLSIVREALKLLNIDEPLEIIYTSDTSARLGLATSSAMAAALLRGLMFYQGHNISDELLMDYTYRLEREILKELGGFQDQVAVCFGGINYIEGQPYKLKRYPVTLTIEQALRFQSHLLMIDTGFRGCSSNILEEQLQKLKRGETIEEALAIKQIVKEIRAIFSMPGFDPLNLIGPMNEAWTLKKSLAGNMCSNGIQDLELKIKEAVAPVGFRLVGGGGGRGIILVIAAPDDLETIKTIVHPLQTLPVALDWEGCKVIKLNHHLGV